MSWLRARTKRWALTCYSTTGLLLFICIGVLNTRSIVGDSVGISYAEDLSELSLVEPHAAADPADLSYRLQYPHPEMTQVDGVSGREFQPRESLRSRLLAQSALYNVQARRLINVLNIVNERRKKIASKLAIMNGSPVILGDKLQNGTSSNKR